ncbi:hypothetical protein AB0I60_04895 [Actinosynnema sp. NPDC050436]|uniref:hypothetical protein n=1 Tax=Actinosynnema sp. NPDC050436 TaxID=3155659 RepID=UPI00340C5487
MELLSVMSGEAEEEIATVVARLLAAGEVAETRPGWFAPVDDARPVDGRAGHDPRRSLLVTHLARVAVRVAVTVAPQEHAGWPAVHGGPVPDPVEAARWTRAHRGHLVAVLSLAGTAGVDERLCELAWALWVSTSADLRLRADAAWRRTLADCGERAARTWGNPVILAGLLERGGRVAAEAGDDVLAESQLVRALSTWHQVRDEARIATVLRMLVEVFGRSGRWHRALDAAFELVGERRRVGGADSADALTLLGEVMVGAGRPEAAVRYWEQADLAFRDADPPSPRRHGLLLVALGRLHWTGGAHPVALRAWHRALALLVDVDDEQADRARALVRLRPGDDLPA